ncbi:Maf family protein [Arundinibacter roseus]|uniref:dTTP/UTP pyrophosphatase n=1 Tax=Arundinibacter roseus TaxID=2070510 RepID=A0A4R4KEK5_9BACT|nr:Maf family protein [Arundinibacter roseus]TDB65292.1 septum formation protein Maf [Arundinibacter roseus]
MNISLTRPLILASNSPRRRQLLSDIGCTFTVDVRPTDEHFPSNMMPTDVPGYLAQEKARQFVHDSSNALILCADTIVVINSQILNKPANEAEALDMLRSLSGQVHQVITAVCLLSDGVYTTRTDSASVYFRTLSEAEMLAYIRTQRPFDKAGGYGIQEWIGMVGIERIEGSYYTIMGLPTHLVYELLMPYFA